MTNSSHEIFSNRIVQAFPDRPVRIVVPTPPGGPPDIMARLLTDKMGAALGQAVIVENRTGGAAGIIGAKTVLGADPDGYTLLMGSTSTLMIAPLIYKNAGYRAESFAPVAGLRREPIARQLGDDLGGQPQRVDHLAGRKAGVNLDAVDLDYRFQGADGLVLQQRHSRGRR